VTGLSESRKRLASYLTQPVVRLLARTRVTPNAVTCFSFLLAVVATGLVLSENLLAAGVVVLVAGFCDILDGALARSTNQVTRFGAILDSTFDRISEALMMLGALVLFARGQSVTGSLVAGVAIVTSLLVSYIRARAEALGVECQVGLFTRAERMVVLALGLLLNQLLIALGIIAVFGLVTVGQRLLYVWQRTRSNPV